MAGSTGFEPAVSALTVRVQGTSRSPILTPPYMRVRIRRFSGTTAPDFRPSHVFCGTTPSADFCVIVEKIGPFSLVHCWTNAQISPDKNGYFLSMHPPCLKSQRLRDGRLRPPPGLACVDFPSYKVRVPWVGNLPTASFRFFLAEQPLPSASEPHHRARGDFHP
jgi:hypothetical protein